MSAPDCHVSDEGSSEGECFKSECSFCVGPVSVGDFVAAPSLVAAGIVHVAAHGGSAGDAGVGGGIGRVENRVGLAVALGAGFALDPYNVAA